MNEQESHELQFTELIRLLLDSGQYCLSRTVNSNLDKEPKAETVEDIKLTLRVKNAGYGNFPIAKELGLVRNLPGMGTHVITYVIEKVGKIDLRQRDMFKSDSAGDDKGV